MFPRDALGCDCVLSGHGNTRAVSVLRLKAAGLQAKTVLKVNEGRPNSVDLMKAGAIQLAIYTPAGAYSFHDEKVLRRTAVAYRIPCITTMSGAHAAAQALSYRRRDPVRVWSLQEIHGRVG